MTTKTLYERLGGYDAIASIADDLMPRMRADANLRRFYEHRGEDGLQRSRQLLIEFICAAAGGTVYYAGRDMKTTHKGMRINDGDWSAFIGYVNDTLDHLRVPQAERDEVVALMQGTRADIVES